MAGCIHVMAIKRVTPSARGCEECLKIDSSWVHLRLCRSCGPDDGQAALVASPSRRLWPE